MVVMVVRGRRGVARRSAVWHGAVSQAARLKVESVARNQMRAGWQGELGAKPNETKANENKNQNKV
jgi:hypothetical protein